MEIESIVDKALRRFVERGHSKGVIEPPRVINMVQLIIDSGSFDELATPPNFGLRPLAGDRVGIYSMAVTRNWRMTFTKIDDLTVANLDLEDYH